MSPWVSYDKLTDTLRSICRKRTLKKTKASTTTSISRKKRKRSPPLNSPRSRQRISTTSSPYLTVGFRGGRRQWKISVQTLTRPYPVAENGRTPQKETGKGPQSKASLASEENGPSPSVSRLVAGHRPPRTDSVPLLFSQQPTSPIAAKKTPARSEERGSLREVGEPYRTPGSFPSTEPTMDSKPADSESSNTSLCPLLSCLANLPTEPSPAAPARTPSGSIGITGQTTAQPNRQSTANVPLSSDQDAAAAAAAVAQSTPPSATPSQPANPVTATPSLSSTMPAPPTQPVTCRRHHVTADRSGEPRSGRASESRSFPIRRRQAVEPSSPAQLRRENSQNSCRTRCRHRRNRRVSTPTPPRHGLRNIYRLFRRLHSRSRITAHLSAKPHPRPRLPRVRHRHNVLPPAPSMARRRYLNTLRTRCPT